MNRVKSLIRIRTAAIAVACIVTSSQSTVLAYTPKEGNILGTVGYMVHRTNFITSHSGAYAPYKQALAFLANGDINNSGQLEVGVFFMNKQYYRDINAVFVGQESDHIHITMGYRWWVMPSLSLGLSFSSAYMMGYVRQLHNDFAPAPSIDTSASDTVEYGFDFSVQTEVYHYDRFTVLLDGIYSLSVTGKPGERADHYGLMVGLKYFIQEKQVVEKPPTAL